MKSEMHRFYVYNTFYKNSHSHHISLNCYYHSQSPHVILFKSMTMFHGYRFFFNCKFYRIDYPHLYLKLMDEVLEYILFYIRVLSFNTVFKELCVPLALLFINGYEYTKCIYTSMGIFLFLTIMKILLEQS